MRNFTWNRFPIKHLLIDSLLTPIVENLNRDMCKFESSQKDESRWQSTDSSKAYRNISAFKCSYLYINCCHSTQGVFPAVTKYFNQTCPGGKPEKQGVVRNQLVVARWSDVSETIKNTNLHALPSSNLRFRRKGLQAFFMDCFVTRLVHGLFRAQWRHKSTKP